MVSVTAFCLALLLPQLALSRVRSFEERNPDFVNEENRLEDDIRLTPEQRRLMLEREARAFESMRTIDCDRVISVPGTITSPNYPNNYPAGLSCVTRIHAPTCTTPKVTFTDFELSEFCMQDKIEIKTTIYGGILYCQSNIAPGVFTSEGYEIVISFFTETDEGKGWSADVTFEPIEGCMLSTTTSSTTTTISTSTMTTTTSTPQSIDCDRVISVPGTITSPNYPNNYPAGLSCVTRIHAPSCTTPRVTFTDFELSEFCMQDKIEIKTTIYGGILYCHSNIAPGVFTSEGYEIVISFFTETDEGKGWSADVTFDPIEGCMPSTTTSSTTTTISTSTITTTPSTPSSTTTTISTSTITTTPSTPQCTHTQDGDTKKWMSPNYGVENYPNNFSCNLADVADSPSITHYAFQDFKLQEKVGGKCVDYVTIDHPYERTKRICGSMTGLINVPGYNFNNFFVTNGDTNNVGFNMMVVKEVNSCTSTIQLSDPDHVSGVITSPDYPNDYPVNAACEWWIQAPEGRRVKVEFKSVTFASNKCPKSYIVVDKVGDGYYLRDNTIRICRSRKAKVVSQANLMKIGFFGGDVPAAGFTATYSLV